MPPAISNAGSVMPNSLKITAAQRKRRQHDQRRQEASPATRLARPVRTRGHRQKRRQRRKRIHQKKDRTQRQQGKPDINGMSNPVRDTAWGSKAMSPFSHV